MSLRRATAVLLLVGLLSGASLCWKYYASSPAAIRAQQQRQVKAARQRLQELRQEMKEVIRSSGKQSPQERQIVLMEWQKAHNEEIRALQQQAFGSPSGSLSNSATEQNRWAMRQQMEALLREAPSADRDNKIALLQEQMKAEREQWQKDRSTGPGVNPEVEARRAAWAALIKERSDLLLSLRQASPEDRRKALEKWEQENGAKLRAIAQPRPVSPAKPGEK
jgi:hypothetical protein